MSYATRYAALKRQQLDALADTPEAVADRLRVQRACQKTKEEVAAMYPVFTVDNAAAAMAYQTERYNYWRNQP